MVSFVGYTNTNTTTPKLQINRRIDGYDCVAHDPLMEMISQTNLDCRFNWCSWPHISMEWDELTQIEWCQYFHLLFIYLVCNVNVERRTKEKYVLAQAVQQKSREFEHCLWYQIDIINRIGIWREWVMDWNGWKFWFVDWKKFPQWFL